MPCQKQMPNNKEGKMCFFFAIKDFFLNYAYKVKLVNFLNLPHFPSLDVLLRNLKAFEIHKIS